MPCEMICSEQHLCSKGNSAPNVFAIHHGLNKCGERCGYGFCCTREKGHNGDHEGHFTSQDVACCRWKNNKGGTMEISLGNKKVYKVLLIDGSPANADARKHSGFKYDLPLKKATGWTPRIEDLIPCLQGYHVVDAEHLMQWIAEYTTQANKKGKARDRDIIVVECAVDGTVLPADDKYVAHSIQLKKILYRWRDVKDAKMKAIADAQAKADKKIADLKAKQAKEMEDLLASVNKDASACILSKGS